MLEEREKSSYLFQNTICDFISISAEMLLDSNNTNVKKVQIDSTLHSKNLTDTTQLQAQTIDSTETSSHNYRPIIITYPRGYDKNRSPRYKLSGRVKYIKRNSSSVERTLRTMDNVWTTYGQRMDNVWTTYGQRMDNYKIHVTFCCLDSLYF